MEETQNNFFFSTELQPRRYDIPKKDISRSPQTDYKKINPSIRIHQAKLQIKEAETLYSQQLKQMMQVKKSLEKSIYKTRKLRAEFVRLYGNKKKKYETQSLLEGKKQFDLKFKEQIFNKTRAQKISNQLGLIYSKNQTQNNIHKIKRQKKRSLENFNRQLQTKRKQQFDEAQKKFMQVKRGQTEFLIRKKNMSAVVSTRAHHNHLTRMNNQMQILQEYKSLLQNFGRYRDEPLNLEETFANKTFFMTTKNTLS